MAKRKRTPLGSSTKMTTSFRKSAKSGNKAARQGVAWGGTGGGYGKNPKPARKSFKEKTRVKKMLKGAGGRKKRK